MSEPIIITPPFTSAVNQGTVNVISAECLGGDIQPIDTLFSSSTWTANLLVFIPMILAESITVAQFFWVNGATVSGHVDVGIYTADGLTKLGSTGSTVAAGTSAIQVVNVTDFLLPAGQRFWLTLGGDDGTQTFWNANLIVAGLDLLGVKQQASGWSSGLPTTITLSTPTVARFPLFGFTGGAVI